MKYMETLGKLLKEAEKELSVASTDKKNESLIRVAESIEKMKDHILEENLKDIEIAYENKMKESLVDRLRLDVDKIDDIIKSIHTVIKLKDPIWSSKKLWTLPNDLTITNMNVPLGVIGIIYESRPNVTVDAFTLALKSGNCIMLRGSSSAINSNKALVKAIKDGLSLSEISPDVVQFVEKEDRKYVNEMLHLNKYVDLVIPRGGSGLIDFVVKNSTIPTIETGVGNCHIFVDESGNLKSALDIITNAKVQRPGVCNACETVLVHESVAKDFLPKLYNALNKKVELRGCDLTTNIIDITDATEEDFKTEYLDYILSIKVVKDIEEAIEHISNYGTKHSESIITENFTNANLFQRKIDAAAVYVNASTRFTDGGAFGFGAEMGISTQKIHARGPIGLEQLVSNKYLVSGNGQIRK